MPVVSNTSPLNYLVLIGEIEILPALHHHVVIPVAVSEELHDPATPDAVRGWIENPPGWLEIRRPKHLPDERLGELGRGERDAILLAEELHVALVVDEAKAYHEARRRNVPVLRTLAVLDKAAEAGLDRPGRSHRTPSANKFSRAAENSGWTSRSPRCSQINSENIAPQVTFHLICVTCKYHKAKPCA